MAYIQITGLNEMRKALGAYEQARKDYSLNPSPGASRRIDQTRAAYEQAKTIYESGLEQARLDRLAEEAACEVPHYPDPKF